MAPWAHLTLPSTAALPHSHRLCSSNRDVYKSLSKLSRASLISLALEWLEQPNTAHCAPFLLADETEENDAPYLAAQSVEDLQELYQELQTQKGNKRELIDRILEGDWRHGLSLYQLAMVETRYMLDHPTSLRWQALRLTKQSDHVNQRNNRDKDERLPHFQSQTFLQSLQREIGPIIKAHYYFSRGGGLPMTLLRVQMLDMPYNTQRALQDITSRQAVSAPLETAKSLFIGFPDAAPFIYASMAAPPTRQRGAEARSLQSIVIDAIPKALSRPQARYALEPTALAAKSLTALLALRGAGRTNSAAGGWGIFAEDQKFHNTLSFNLKEVKRLNGTDDIENIVAGVKRKTNTNLIDAQKRKHSKLTAAARFGSSGLEADGKGIERLEIRIDDAFAPWPEGGDRRKARDQPGEHPIRSEKSVKSGRHKRPSLLDKQRSPSIDEGPTIWKPDVCLSFQGSHVFAGIRLLVESGIVDGQRMPGWMTGESGVSIGVVRDGKMRLKAEAIL